MGLSIGQSAANFSAVRSAEVTQISLKAVAGNTLSESNKLTGVSREEEQARRAERTTSPQGLALRTININLERARDLVPSLEEVRARAREARTPRPEEDEAPENALRREDEEGKEEDERPVETVRLAPSPQARRFEETDAEVRRLDANPDGAAQGTTQEEGAEVPPAPKRIDLFA